ncbi:MAG: hypothetical protein RLY20_2580 [Verrucomicrobiota bacterium]|jgi:extracellular factor (EF) 3-hydroxypalmitic acid methyl ester biosynthesis protein
MPSHIESTESGSGKSLIRFKTRAGTSETAVIRRVSRYEAAFSVYGPSIVIETSETLTSFELMLAGITVYAGRAVVKTTIPESGGVSYQVTLGDEGWREVNGTSPTLAQEFNTFISEASQRAHIIPEFRLVVADMFDLLSEIRLWTDKLETELGQPTPQSERAALDQLRPVSLPLLHRMFERFEAVALAVPANRVAEHAAYARRILHPLVLCAPFMHRTFAKPLGYAGDYEMVAMMARDPYEGDSTFAKLLNTYFLDTAPVVAHRQRLEMLTSTLLKEACRAQAQGRRLRVYNLGCGPAWEIRDLIRQHEIASQIDFTLLDFNEETIKSTGSELEALARQHRRNTTVRMMHKSVTQVLKDAAKSAALKTAAGFDLVYCAGLFDYLNDAVCEKLVEVFYNLVAPGGLVLVTNVDSSNPCRGWMEFAVDWHLIYRDAKAMKRLIPPAAVRENAMVRSDRETGVNIFLEIRKP